MGKFVKWLNRPYPFDGEWKHYFRSAGWGAVFVTGFLTIFRPFGIRVGNGEFLISLKVFSYFGIITALVILFTGLVILSFPKTFKEETWKVKHEIGENIFTILLIGTANMLLGQYLWNWPFSWTLFWYWQWVTLMVGLVPIFSTIFMKQNRLNRRHTDGAAQLNSRLEPHSNKSLQAPPESPQLSLAGDNLGEELSLAPTALLYLEAADNYVRVFYENSHGLDNTLLRSTLKKMESQLSEHPQFFRCHRTYLVNLDRVKHVSGNAQGYKLHLEGIDNLVPVSRSLNEEINIRMR